MQLSIVDALAPFFPARARGRGRINWSKICFSELGWGPGSDPQWEQIEEDMRVFAGRVAAIGFNAVTLDDVAHLVPHPLYEQDIRARAEALIPRFARLVNILEDHGLSVYFTTDYLTLTPAVAATLKSAKASLAFFRETLAMFFDRFPTVQGVVLRVGESDASDVKDPLRSFLAARTARGVNRLLKESLPLFESRSKTLIFRTWTVGAGIAGDLLWHRRRFSEALEGIDSASIIISMKPGESDFFRCLPVNQHFFRTPLQKIIELQARREYEGAGEYPSFTGWETEQIAHALHAAQNLIGCSVWCQTGGWHRFRRRAFLEPEGCWTELNAQAAIAVFRDKEPIDDFLTRRFGPEGLEFFRLCDQVINDLLYIREFAHRKLFFRRVRIPPLIHVYWDRIFVVEPLREILRRYVTDHSAALREGEQAFALFPRMRALAEKLSLPVQDIDFMRDSLNIVRLARQYFFRPFTQEIAEEIHAAKAAYKADWPKGTRPRYRIRISFAPTPLRLRVSQWFIRLALRQQRGYRTFLDRLFTLNILSWAYRVFAMGYRKRIPKFLRKSAMGVDAVLK